METEENGTKKRTSGEMLGAQGNISSEEVEILPPPPKKQNMSFADDERVEQVQSELVEVENIFYRGRRDGLSNTFNGREVEDRGILREYPLTRTTEFHCDICGKDVTHEVRIKCFVSKADICLQCFKDGKETEKHTPSFITLK